jgi:hypothetical protein
VGALAYMAPSDMSTLQASSGGLTWAQGDLSSVGIQGIKGKDQRFNWPLKPAANCLLPRLIAPTPGQNQLVKLHP